jgi:hypothetical protein
MAPKGILLSPTLSLSSSYAGLLAIPWKGQEVSLFGAFSPILASAYKASPLVIYTAEFRGWFF